MKLALNVLCLSLISVAAFAADTVKHEGPCKKIKEACEAGGYTRHGHKAGGKGLWADCMKSLNEGKPVAGVTVSPDDVKACQDKKAKHEAKKAAK